MSRYKPKVPPADPIAAQSWVGKIVRDTKLDVFGLVHGVAQDKEGVRLEARFPGEKRSRKIALEATSDGEYVMPGDVKARYRPPSAEERERLEASKKK